MHVYMIPIVDTNLGNILHYNFIIACQNISGEHYYLISIIPAEMMH